MFYNLPVCSSLSHFLMELIAVQAYIELRVRVQSSKA